MSTVTVIAALEIVIGKIHVAIAKLHQNDTTGAREEIEAAAAVLRNVALAESNGAAP